MDIEDTNKKLVLMAPKDRKKVVEHDPDKLIAKGHDALASLQFELAIRFFSRALESRPNDCNIIDLLADVYIQIGDCEKAYELLTKSINLEPESNPCKWCSYAQLQEGSEALSSYQTAIKLLTKERENIANTVCQSYLFY